MSHATGEAIAILIAGILLGLWALLCIRSGKSYISTPPAQVSRKDDPFSFWLSVAPLLVVAAIMIAGALVQLVAQ